MILQCVMLVFAAFAAEPPVDDLPLRPIPGPESPPPETPWETYLLVALAVLVAVVALCVLVAYLRRRRPAPLIIPPHAWALAELDRLEKHGDPAERQLEWLANIVRRYLSLRFQMQAPAQTTEEFRRALGEHPELPPARQEWVLELLVQADLVKFARGLLGKGGMESQIAAVRQFIADTAGLTAPPGSPST